MGRGRWGPRYGAKRLVESFGPNDTEDVLAYRRMGAIRPGDTRLGFLEVDWTRCNYGGWRPWFLCPECGKRAAKLYRTRQRTACRGCSRLGYLSQCQVEDERLISQAEKIKQRIVGIHVNGVKLWSFEDYPPKPRGMWWRTYYRLLHRGLDLENRSWQYFLSSCVRQFPGLFDDVPRQT